MLEKIKELTNMYAQTLEWGCNDRAKYLYANAIHAVVSENDTYEECIQEFVDYMHENGIH